MMKIVRAVLGAFILFLDRLTRPKAKTRPPDAQSSIDKECTSLVLYHFEACPFCVKVRRHIHRLGLNIGVRDVKRDAVAKQELLSGGGEYQVPCLRIEESPGHYRWLYESNDINNYLSQRFS